MCRLVVVIKEIRCFFISLSLSVCVVCLRAAVGYLDDRSSYVYHEYDRCQYQSSSGVLLYHICYLGWIRYQVDKLNTSSVCLFLSLSFFSSLCFFLFRSFFLLLS